MASGVAAFPSSHNVVIPDTESTGNLRIEFSRNPKKFALNQWAQIIPVTKTDGLYTEITNEEAGRVLIAGETAWPDGANSPSGLGNTESFKHKSYRTDRHSFSTTLGDMTIAQAPWDIKAQHLRILAQRAMTRRTKLALTALTTSGNYASTHTSAVDDISGVTGTWAASTVAYQNIRRSLMYAVNVIEQDTLSSISVDEMALILSPDLAGVMAASGEIADYLKSSRYAGPVLTGAWAGMNTRGLPESLYGVKVIIENTANTTSRRGATAAKSYLMGNATAALVARKGGLEGVEGPSFSTLSIFAYGPDDMTVETIPDVKNRNVELRVVDNIDVQMTAPVSGFLFTSCQ